VSKDQRHIDYHNACLTKLFDSSAVDPKLTFSRDVFQTELSKSYIKGMSISGIQKKLSLKIENNKLTLTNIGGTYILKPTVEEFPELAENEHLSMLIGRLLDIETSPLGLVEFSNGELVYIIKRFDWSGDHKIHKEDMVSIFNLNRDENENYKYSQSYEAVGKKLKEITGGKLAVVLDFFNRLVYNYLIQNGDYHLKNISVIAEKLSPYGHYNSLAPNYDSVMTRLYFPNESELALDFLMNDEFPREYQSVGFFTRPDFEELGSRIDLIATATSVIFDKINKRKSEIFELVDSSFLTPEKKIAFKDKVAERMKKLNLKV
jgi:serine/threonine-protein kinase HipA